MNQLTRKICLRVLSCLVTSPVWIALGAMLLVTVTPIIVLCTLSSVLNFAFTGEWEWMM